MIFVANVDDWLDISMRLFLPWTDDGYPCGEIFADKKNVAMRLVSSLPIQTASLPICLPELPIYRIILPKEGGYLPIGPCRFRLNRQSAIIGKRFYIPPIYVGVAASLPALIPCYNATHL